MTAMTNPMYEVSYDRMNFNFDVKEQRHPRHITEKDYIYHLRKDERGFLVCERDINNEPIRSPRKLRNICLNRLVSDSAFLSRLNSELLPTNVYPLLLTEAIFLREPQSIEWIVTTWPMKKLRIFDVIPLEDCLEDDYLTLPFEGNDEVSLVDCLVLGLLKLKPESNLKLVDFTRFDKDRKLCKELCRLPILWMKPSDRTVEKIHEYMSETIEVTKDKVQCFLNRISAVYSNIDSEFKHGNKIEPITVLLDLHMNIDDVPIGLSLQHYSPFKFSCHRLWVKPVPDVHLQLSCLGRVLDTNRITHLEYEDPLLSYEESKVTSLLEALNCLQNLAALSLPDCINTSVSQTLAEDLNKALKYLKHLQRLNLSYCNIRGHLSNVLGGLNQRIAYLNLKDCRLNEDDIFFLVTWRNLAYLRELNLSCNSLQLLDQVVIVMLEKMPLITCLSVSFCSLSIHSQVLIARECKECSRLKVLCMQGYTPPSREDVLELLHICSQIRTLQKAVLFPEAYAFPGNIEQEREMNKYHTMVFSYRFMESNGRPDIQLDVCSLYFLYDHP